MALPIQLFHPVFQQFIDRINDPEFKSDIETIASVSKLMSTTMELFSSESDALSALRPILSGLLGPDLVQMPSKASHAQDALIHKRIDGMDVPLVCFEYKLALGQGNCDPSVQAAHSVREFLVKDQVCGFRLFYTPR
jgi:hypothetical protein